MGEGTRDGGTGKKTLTLLSPVGGPPLTYTWPLQQLVRGKCAVDEAHELLDTIRWVIKEHPVLREGPIENSTKNIVISDYDCMKQLCDMYNSETKKISCQTNSTNREPASKALLRVILHRTYAHAVFDPEKLNSYQPFSPEVYGETSFEMIDQLMDDVPFKTGATFLDLGSGVGQVVLQVAASNICRICYGIEQAATPCYYAKAMATHFIRWMNFFGKPFSEFKMMEGDFLDDKYRAILQDSNTIFVNNFAFGPSLNHKLKERFAKFAEGVKIISSSEFRPINFRITTRNITDVGTILRVREVHPRVPGSVSWTNNDVCYFIHTVDRSYLEEYMRLQRAKYGDKLESLMINADRKIKERCEDYKALPALSLESDHRTHLLSNLTEIEVPKVSSIGDLHELLNSHLSEYMSQCSSSYGEAALQLELEQSRVLKERLEEQLDHLDRNVHTEEEQVVTALDNRLAELGIKSRDPQGIGKELLYQVTGFKILHKRLDRLSSEVTNYQTAIKSSLLREVSTWRDNHERYTEYSTEVGIKQRVYQDVVSQLPGYDFKSLASVCQETAKGYKDRTKSLSKILLSIESLEKDNLQLEKELAVKREKLAAKKRVEEMASAAAAAEAARLLPTLPPKSAIKPELVAAKAVTIPLPMSVPEPVPVAATVKPREPSQPKPQLIGPPKLPLTAHPTSHSTSHPVKIPTELTKPRPKPSVVIEQPITDVLVRPDMKDSAGMSHLDAILARNGLGHYIGNDYNTKRPEEYLLAQGHEQYRRRERSETKSGENTPSRPSSTTSNISHRSILQQQHKQINNINSLLIQQQTMAQREQKMAVGNDLGGTLAALRNPDMIPRNEQALLNEQMMHIETPARGELKQTEEKVLSSGTVPAKYPGSNTGSGYKEKTSMLKTTSPRLQLTTQTSNAKTTVLVPHYMLGNNKDSTTAETMLAVKPSNASTPGSASSSAIKSTPIPKSGSTGSSLPSTASSQLSATISQLGSSSSSYFSAYGSTADPLAQKPGDQNYPGPPPPAKPTSTEPPKAQIPKPKHKYPFQYLNQVYITGYAIMIHTLKAQYPNLRPELFNDLLSRSNFNPYTYFEYLKKLDNFEMTLESFYEMRPDLGEKCKTRAQRLAEKQAAQKLPEKGTTPQSATPTVPVPSTSLPITSSANNAPPAPPPRPAKEPQISIPRNNSNTTIIESYISSKGPPAPINSGPQPPPPGLITTELRLTKPSRDLKSPPHQFPFKSPNSSIHYPGESPNKTSPAKRPECSLQYHHLSLESFKNEPKNKVRRRNTSSDVKQRNSSESEKISPTKKEAKRTDDVTETAMMMLQLQQSIQQKHTMQKKPEAGQLPENPRAELERQLAQSENQLVSSGDNKPREHSSYRHDRPKHNSGASGRHEPYPKDHVYRTNYNKIPEQAPKTMMSRSLPEYPNNTQVQEYGMKMNAQYREQVPPYRSRESSGQHSHGDAEGKSREETARDLSGISRNGHISDPKGPKVSDPTKERSRDSFQYQYSSDTPNQLVRTSNFHSREGNAGYREQHVQREQHLNREGHSVREPHRESNSHPPQGHVQRDPNGTVRENHVQGRDVQSRDLQRDPQQPAPHRDPNVTLSRGSSREHPRNQNRAPPAAQPQTPLLSNHRDSSTNNREHSLTRPVSKHEKVSPKEKEKSTPKMPDLNKPASYNSMDHLKHLELQKELKLTATASAKPPLHNPRTHMITSAIPPPELKKARNFKDVHPRDLPSQPPEMRIAPTHIDSRSSYVSHQAGNLPHPVNNRPEERKKSEEKKRTDDKVKLVDHSVKKHTDIPTRKSVEPFPHPEETNNNDLKRKIEVKTVPSVKKSSVKENPKLAVVTKTSDGKSRPTQDHRSRDDLGKHLHTSRIREEQVSKAREEKAREESRLREEQHKALAASASLAFEFKGSPEPPARPKLSSEYNSRPKTLAPNEYNPARSKPPSVDATPRTEDPASSPELVIEEEEKTEPTVKAIPDSSRHSPDSSSCVNKNTNGANRITNGGSSVLGYDLEDVSPPSTSPDHPKRDITQDALMESFVNNKRRRVDQTYNHHENSNELKLTSEHQKVDEKPKELNKHSKFSFSNSIERPREDKSYLSTNGTLLKTREDLAYGQDPVFNHTKSETRPSFDERPIQSQDLSSSSTDLSNTDNKS